MIRDVESTTIDTRESNNLDAAEQVRAGIEQHTFALENNPKVLEGLTWNESTILDWDTQATEYGSTINKVEHGDAWTLQRDMNYAYSDRKRLLDIGMDSRFGGADVAKYTGSKLPRLSLEDPEEPSEPSP